MSDNGLVEITINGRRIRTSPGRMLIDVAEEHDIFVPRFCYHPGLDSVAACRMCLVEIEGARRPLDPACATPVADGMVVKTDSAPAAEAQEAMLELLLINHPLDCPICDRGGECPLQDQALRFGPGRSRYTDEKRHFPKPVRISDLVVLDRERCVLCWRCVRFCEEVSGDTFIDLMDRGSHTQINVAEGKPFDSYFSGNTIQICPVGALTSSSYRFLSRPWDLVATESTCSFCSVGCPITLEQRGGEVLRAQALPNEHVNSFWNCDKGRFGHRYVSHPGRLVEPLTRRPGAGAGQEFAAISWDDALDRIAGGLRGALASGGPSAVGLIGGSHLTNEDLYAASKFFREVAATSNLDFRIFDAGFPYERLVPEANGVVGSTARLDDLDSAAAILWFGPDPTEELPILSLRVRRAVVRGGARLVVAHPRRIGLAGLGIHLPFAAGAEAELLAALRGEGVPAGSSAGVGPDRLHEAREALSSGPVVVCTGPQFVGDRAGWAPQMRGLVESLPEAGLLLCVPNANSQGAIDMGVVPWTGPGQVPAERGLGTLEMLRASAEGKLRFLWVMGADLTGDLPDAALADQALSSSVFLVVSDLFPTETGRAADLLLPAASFAEKEGSYTNLERRIQKVNPAVRSPGAARPDWRIFADLAKRMGAAWGWSSAADVASEIALRVPTHAGFSWEVLEDAPGPLAREAGVAPEVGHAAGASGAVVGGRGVTLAHERASVQSDSAWPLRWELRAVDATRRRGWIWGDGGPDVPPGGPDVPRGSSEAGSERTSYANPSYAFPLRLLCSRVLYDGGQMVSRSPELRNLTPPVFVEIHPDEARSRGLAEGETVTVTSGRGSLRAALKVSDRTPPGTAFVPFGQPGGAANVLMDSSQEATFVEVGR